MKNARIFVSLGAKEYGNDVMKRIADETASRIKGYDTLVVNVYEHGGWFLQYAYNEHYRGKIVGTANDMAQWDGETTALRNRLLDPSIEWEMLPEIRR